MYVGRQAVPAGRRALLPGARGPHESEGRGAQQKERPQPIRCGVTRLVAGRGNGRGGGGGRASNGSGRGGKDDKRGLHGCRKKGGTGGVAGALPGAGPGPRIGRGGCPTGRVSKPGMARGADGLRDAAAGHAPWLAGGAAGAPRRLAARLPDSLTQEPPQAGLARRRGCRGTGAAAARVVNPFTMWFAPIGKPRQGALLRATRWSPVPGPDSRAWPGPRPPCGKRRFSCI